MIITLDGPAGVGKSTLAKQLAQYFNIACLDTGAMYRVLALKLGATIADMEDDALEKKLNSFSFSLINQDNDNVLCVDNVPIGEEIRVEKVGRLAAVVASFALVRKALHKYQREIGEKNSLVAEGRDMGTAVFPKAIVKFFLDARPEIRAKRRFDQLAQKNSDTCPEYSEILKEIIERDEKDRTRKDDPLKPADDAIIVDTSDLTAHQVFEKLVKIAEEKILKDSDICTTITQSNKENNEMNFTHLAKDGSLSMVAVEHKPNTFRKALATGFVCMNANTVNLLKQKALPKGDVLSVAKVAGIMAAKRTAEYIPLCHSILLSYVDIRFFLEESSEKLGVSIISEVRTSHNTGVEMEAIMAVQVAAATIYDMVKAVQKDMHIEDVHLLYKEGGKNNFQAPDYTEDFIKKFQ